MENEPLSDYEKESLDYEEFSQDDIKVDLDYHINTTLMKLQIALTKENVKDGFLQYRTLIEYLLTLCKAKKYIPDDYEEKLKDFLKSDEYNQIKDPLIQSVRLANQKLDLVLPIISKKKVATEPLKA